MKRLIEKTVFSGLVTAWRLATCPTRRSPVLVKATTDGVSRLPSGLVMTTGSPPSMTATTELVVPRSMPMILLMIHYGSESLSVKIPSLADSAGGGNGGDGGNGFTGGTQKRRRTEGRSIGWRATHADSCDVREPQYKPPKRHQRLYWGSRTSQQAAFGGQSNGRRSSCASCP